MNIYHIREFIEIAKHNSFSEAAVTLSISQSSLSKHIRSLEDELGVLLFDRSTRSVSLSTYGELFLPMANEMLMMYENIMQKMQETKKQEKHLLKLASIPVMAQYGITGIITKFQKDHPEIRLQLIESEGTDISKLMEDGRCELAFTRKVGNPVEERFDHLTYFPDKLCVLLQKTHPLAKNRKIDLTSLKNEAFLFMDERTLLYSFCYNACLEAGFKPDITYSGHRPENIIDLTAKGAGVSLLMKQQALFHTNKLVTSIDITPSTEADVCLTRMKKNRLSYSAQLFWNYVAERIQNTTA